MQIEYKNRTLQKECTIANIAEKKHGITMAEKIHQRIGEIEAADSVETMVKFRIGRCHQLKGARKNQYAMDLVHSFRLVFEVNGSEVQIARIVEITNYH